MTKIATVLGARPQFVKASVISRALRLTAGVREILIHTGQHFDPEMSDIFFKELDIPLPDHHLGISGGGHGAMTGAMLQKLEPLLQDIAPDWVLVYGDTNSTLAGAVAASKLHIPVAHVEAGLRSFNRRMPEEHNRVLTDHIADLLFTPTDIATENLHLEGIPLSRIHQVGDVMFDALLYFSKRAKELSMILSKHSLKGGQYVLATVHRAENTDKKLRLITIMQGLDDVAKEMPVILPLHPRTRAALKRENIYIQRLKIIEPVGYLHMVALEANAAVIATDSGGVQKEAYFHGVPCVTLRDETEWMELVDGGWNILVSPESANIANQILKAIGSTGKPIRPYGNGNAARLIVEKLVDGR